jgi:hypothetical protein
MRFWLPALVALAVIPVAAHHPASSYYDVTRPASISGPIVELRAVNPHAVLIVDGTGPDGRTGRWAFEGLPPNVFQRRGPTDFRERLKPGTIITISGWPANDPRARAFSANTITFADGTTMLFGSTTLEGHWRVVRGCDSPCPDTYAYPDAQ